MSDPTTATSDAASQPAIEGWFTTGIDAALLGTRCHDSGTYFFPPETTVSRAPGFADSALEPVELSRTGRLWSYTNAGYQPPDPYVSVTDPYVPFCIAAVELEKEQMVVLGQCPAGVTVDDLEVGMEMELVIDTLFVDEDGVEQTVWKWQPAGWAGNAKGTN